MKKFIYFFLLISFCIGSTSAQIQVDPRNFPDSNYSWNEQSDYIDFEFNDYDSHQLTYYDAGDTIVDGIHYRKLNFIDVYIDYDWSNVGPGNPYPVFISNKTGLFALIRNDKENKKVYLLYEGETEEQLLFNFNLKLNDTINMNYFNNFNSAKSYVVDVDSLVDPNGVTRKIFEISISPTGSSGDFNTFLIEGIGLSIGIYTKLLSVPFERFYLDLLCIDFGLTKKFSFGGSSNFINAIDSCNFTKFQYLGINKRKAISIKTFPNPAENSIYFSLDSKIDKMEIFDSKLDLVLKEDNLITKTANISSLIPGIYFCKIYSNNNYYNAKFIKK